MSEYLFFGGDILTQNPQAPRAEAVLVRDGKIFAVGHLSALQALASPNTQRIDLGGACLIPGFNDAHVHVWKVGHLLTTMLDLRGVGSIDDMQTQMRDFGDKLPQDAWFMGRGYNEASMSEGRHPTRHDLDAVFPDRPAYLIRTCAHIAVANSKALELAGVTAATAAPPGGIIELGDDGQPNGLLHETALGVVFNHIPSPTAGDYQAMLTACMQHQVALGITSATDPGVVPELMSVYRSMDAAGALINRMNVMAIRRPDGGTETLPLPEKHLSDHLRVDTVKFFADGGLSGATAALTQHYRHAQTQGVARFEEDELFDLARDAHLGGYRIGTHAIGDAAIDMVLRVYERLYALGAGQRHRIEHLGLPNADHLRRAAQAGIIAAPQTVFLHSLGGNFRRYLPDSLLAQCYPIRAMLDAGVTVALSSDAPVVKDDNPLLGMQAAITRKVHSGETIAPSEAITPAEALYAYTMGGAIASGDADNRGSIETGKWADLTILSDNPLTHDPAALTDITVQQTYVGGALVYEA